jgi:5-formyltetrahydrofolate cyclo-ligase
MHKMQQSKSLLRESIRMKLRDMTAESRAAASGQVRTRLEQHPAWRDAGSVLLFAPLPQEVDIWPMVEAALAAGKSVALPQFDLANGEYVACEVRELSADLAVGRLGIREPNGRCRRIDLGRLDLLLVPGLGFDQHGRQIGRGKGYYDRLLKQAGGIKWGVAFDEQIVGEVPVESHDIRLDCVVTPTRWIEPG